MSNESNGGNPAGRGGAGAYIEGELGAYYLLSMLAGNEPRGAPGCNIIRVRFQAVDEGYALDDLVVHGSGPGGDTVLEVQSKRTIKLSPKDPVFSEVCAQIATAVRTTTLPLENHLLAVATQRTSFKISGPYQDLLKWARAVETSTAFFHRLTAKGVAGPEMREFVESFRANLRLAGLEQDDDGFWRTLRRFRILEFDFEAGASQSRAHALYVARGVLAAEDADRAEALWSTLIDTSLTRAKVGGSIDRFELRGELVQKGFRLAGDRDFAISRGKLAEMTKHALADIGQTVSGYHLPRQTIMSEVDLGRDGHRFVQLRGGPGIGKSSLLRSLAGRILSESRAIVLDPIGTPAGGWSELALRLGLATTARDFLGDIATTGGATLFIDSLEMFVDVAQRRTVNDVLREVSAIEGFTVIATARTDFGANGDDWLAEDAMRLLGPARTIEVGDLDDAEVNILTDQTPELRALLSPDHPAAQISRNLYRLSRLLKVRDTAPIRTEAALALNWWETADGIDARDVRAAQRILADLADAALAGGDGILLRDDSVARNSLIGSQTLREAGRDRLTFYHDVLRDWAIGMRLDETPELLANLDLTRPVSPTIARGVEMAGRLALERGIDDTKWSALLSRLSEARAHGSWRRHALLAMVRSEMASTLLERNTNGLLEHGGRLLSQFCGAVIAVESVRLANLVGTVNSVEQPGALPSSLRVTVTPAATRLLQWCVAHSSQIPIQVIGAVTKLGQTQLPLYIWSPQGAAPFAKMFYGWLMQLDPRDAVVTIASDPNGDRMGTDAHRRTIQELRTLCLLLAAKAPDEARSYLTAITAERDQYKIKGIRTFSKVLAGVAPDELAAMIEVSLIEPEQPDRRHRSARDRAFGYADSDYLPPSPAQPPFLDLLDAAPTVGLALVRRLVNHAVRFHFGGREPGEDGFWLTLRSGRRFFPWIETYFWSRDQAPDYSPASALMSLEAWGHSRIEAGESVEDVIDDVLGLDGEPAAYLLVAVDLLISHWPKSREALVPFVANPTLLAFERGRIGRDQMNARSSIIGDEPQGRVRLKDLRDRASRGVPLERLLPFYAGTDDVAATVRRQLQHDVDGLEPYSPEADFGHPAFMGAYAMNMLNKANWVEVEGGFTYQSPPEEAAHLKRLLASRGGFLRDSEIEAKVSLASSDRAHGSAAVAQEAAEFADGALPDGNEVDFLKSGSTRLVATAMLVARDGDVALLEAHETWVRKVIDLALCEDEDRVTATRSMLNYNRPGLAINALIHLWHRKRLDADRDALIAIAGRSDRAGAPAFAEAMGEVIATDARVAKSVLRAALSVCRYRWGPWDEDPGKAEAYERQKSADREKAVADEVAWLNGGTEPNWPVFPDETPSVRKGRRIPSVSSFDKDDELEDDEAAHASEHADGQMAATWLNAIAIGAHPEFEGWLRGFVDHYAEWTAIANGLGFEMGTELDHAPTEWNQEFYELAARVLMEGSEETFDRLWGMSEGLPDQPFSRIAGTLIHSADVWYFNQDQSAKRPIILRTRAGLRIKALRRWDLFSRPGDLSIDFDTGPVVATFFMNTYNAFSSTRTYLVPAVFDRIDPLLDTLRALLPGGPTPFIAMCTLNTLMLKPEPRHAEFLVSAAEAWLERFPADTALWLEVGIGRRTIAWLEAASDHENALLGRSHPLRKRIDGVVGRLVGLGVPEAHEFEQRVEQYQLNADH